MQSAITSIGQATIPKAIRKHLHLQPGDRIKFFINPDGSVAILPTLPTSSVTGIVSAGKRVSSEEMQAAIAEGATSRYKRLLKQ